jgi:hypothetical protein
MTNHFGQISVASAVKIIVLLFTIQLGSIAVYMIWAESVAFDDTQTGLNAANVQVAIDKLDGNVDIIRDCLDAHLPHTPNDAAQFSGKKGKTAEEIYYQDYESYSNKLGQLLTIDPYLTYDPEVTFTFLGTNLEGYTFLTSHAQGDKSFRFWD